MSTEDKALRELLRQAANCMASAVKIEHVYPDEPPMPADEWSYGADQLVHEIRAALAAQAEAPAPVGEPVARPISVEKDFRWDSAALAHYPRLIIEFEPVPAGKPNDEKGWRDRDALASYLAAPSAQPAQSKGLPGPVATLGCDNAAGSKGLNQAPSAQPAQAEPANGLELAVIGRNHFGNPIPQEWYAAAKELLAANHPQATGGAGEVQLPTHEQIEHLAADMCKSGALPWLGFRKDAEGSHTIPVVSLSQYKLVLAAIKQFAAPKPQPQAGEREGWQDISTAPDETDVLIGRYVGDEWRMCQSARCYDCGNQMAGEQSGGWFWDESYCNFGVTDSPTHWMPLPAGPKAGELESKNI